MRLISAGAVLGAFAVVSLRPYIAARFSVWGHVWEFANSTGYQQTRTMMAAASGGLLGVGGGNGYLVKVPAANTDLVFWNGLREMGAYYSAYCGCYPDIYGDLFRVDDEKQQIFILRNCGLRSGVAVYDPVCAQYFRIYGYSSPDGGYFALYIEWRFFHDRIMGAAGFDQIGR